MTGIPQCLEKFLRSADAGEGENAVSLQCLDAPAIGDEAAREDFLAMAFRLARNPFARDAFADDDDRVDCGPLSAPGRSQRTGRKSQAVA